MSKQEKERDSKDQVSVKKTYKKPELIVHSLDEAILVAASRSGMGMCKQTYIL
jgi:hypothetical protein